MPIPASFEGSSPITATWSDFGYRSSRSTWRSLTIGLLVLAVSFAMACAVGSVHIPFFEFVWIVLAKVKLLEGSPSIPDSWDTIIWQIRMPRVLLSALVGAGLAIAGATYQGLFRNPLAEPYLLGVASGAGLGATVVLMTGVPLVLGGFSLLPVVAFSGGLSAAGIAYFVARRSGGLPLTTLILSGVAVGLLASALTSLLMLRSNPDVRPILAWLLGGFSGTQWKEVQMVLPYLIPCALGMVAYGRVLNLFQLSEDESMHLGVSVYRTKLLLIVIASLTTAAAVSVSGLIGFVGLIAPHTVRLIWGHDYRFLLPMSMIIGATFLILADLLARIVVSPTELPVGVITALCGVPFFLYLLQRDRRLT